MQYIVSGYARSGTSMMMRCLELAGIPAYYDKTRTVKAGTNKYGSYEVPLSESKSKQAYDSEWASMFDHPGMVVKILCRKILYIPDGDYKIVYMLRDPESIYESYEHHWGKAHPLVMQDAKRIQNPANYDELMTYTLDRLEEKGLDVQILNYEDVVKFPETAFGKLKRRGWPINVKAAMSGVEPGEKHF